MDDPHPLGMDDDEDEEMDGDDDMDGDEGIDEEDNPDEEEEDNQILDEENDDYDEEDPDEEDEDDEGMIGMRPDRRAGPQFDIISANQREHPQVPHLGYRVHQPQRHQVRQPEWTQEETDVQRILANLTGSALNQIPQRQHHAAPWDID